MFGATQLSSYCRTRPFAGVSQLGQRRPMLLCNSSKGFGAETAKVGTSRHRVSHLQLPYLSASNTTHLLISPTRHRRRTRSLARALLLPTAL